jgi:hypothetical protein
LKTFACSIIQVAVVHFSKIKSNIMIVGVVKYLVILLLAMGAMIGIKDKVTVLVSFNHDSPKNTMDSLFSISLHFKKDNSTQKLSKTKMDSFMNALETRNCSLLYGKDEIFLNNQTLCMEHLIDLSLDYMKTQKQRSRYFKGHYFPLLKSQESCGCGPFSFKDIFGNCVPRTCPSCEHGSECVLLRNDSMACMKISKLSEKKNQERKSMNSFLFIAASILVLIAVGYYDEEMRKKNKRANNRRRRNARRNAQEQEVNQVEEHEEEKTPNEANIEEFAAANNNENRIQEDDHNENGSGRSNNSSVSLAESDVEWIKAEDDTH